MKIASLKNNSLILKGNAIETSLGVHQDLRGGSLSNWDNGEISREDFFEDFDSLSNWTNQGLATFKLVGGSLHTEAPADSWGASPYKCAKHTLSNPLTGDFVLKAELEWLSRPNDLAEIYLVLFNSSDEVVAWAGIRDAWSASSGGFSAKIGSSDSFTGQGTRPNSGFAEISIIRKDGTIDILEGVEKRNTGVNTDIISRIELTNNRYQTYSGKTAIWNYIHIYSNYKPQGLRVSEEISISNAYKLESSKVMWKENKRKLLFNNNLIQTEYIPNENDLGGGFSFKTSVVFSSIGGVQTIGVFTTPRLFVGLNEMSWYMGCGDVTKTSTAITPKANVKYDIRLDYTGGRYFFYVDEVLIATSTATFSGTNTNKLRLGVATGSSHYFKGYILSASLEDNSKFLCKWNLDEGSGNIVYDEMGKYHGDIVGATWTDFGAVVKNEIAISLNDGREWGPFIEVNNGSSIPNLTQAKEAVFNGSDSFVSMSNSHNFGNGSFSITGWFSATNTNHTGQIISKAESSGQEKGYQIRVINDKIHCRLFDGATRINIDSSSFIEAGKMYEFTFVVSRENNNAILYIDGEEIKRVNSLPLGSLDVASPFMIGSAFTVGSTYYRFNGSIGEVSVYNRALSPGEVLAKSKVLDAISHYPLDEGAGNIAYDVAGSYSGTYGNIGWRNHRLDKKRDLRNSLVKIKTTLSSSKPYFSPSVKDLKIEVEGEGFSFSKNGDLYNKGIEEVASSFSTDFSSDTISEFPKGFGVEYGNPRCWVVEEVSGVKRLKVYQDDIAGATNMISSTASDLFNVDIYSKVRILHREGVNRTWYTIGGRINHLFDRGPYSGYFLGICRNDGEEYVAMYRIEADETTGIRHPRLSAVNDTSVVLLGSKKINNFDTSNPYNLRIRIEGGNIKGKFWPNAISEPSAWDFNYNDSSPLQAGYAGISNYQAFDSHGVIVYEYSHNSLKAKKTKMLKNKKLILEGFLEEE